MTQQHARRPYRMVARAEKHERTRQAIVAAMRQAVMTTAFPSIRVADVAAAAGVSPQTVQAHFASKEALFVTALAEVGQELQQARRSSRPGDVVGIVRSLVAEYERYGDVNWSLLPLEPDVPAVAEVLAAGRAGHRAWLVDAFGPLLPPGAARRRAALDALYAATDVGTWKLLRRDLGLSAARTRAVMRTLVRGALAPAGGG